MLAMGLFVTMLDDLELMDWFLKQVAILNNEAKLNDNLLNGYTTRYCRGCYVLGTTTFSDMYFLRITTADVVKETVFELYCPGLALLSPNRNDQAFVENAADLFRTYHGVMIMIASRSHDHIKIIYLSRCVYGQGYCFYS